MNINSKVEALIKKAYFQGFYDGFDSSEEGYNGEYGASYFTFVPSEEDYSKFLEKLLEEN